MATRTLRATTVSVIAALVLLAIVWQIRRRAEESKPVHDVKGSPGRWDPSGYLTSSPELLSLGKQAYEKQCATCHGAAGDGRGEAAYLLYPKPRDFVAGAYRIVSTWEGVPTDDDLFRTISRGMPGSAMPSWAHLTEETRWALVHFIKSFAKFPIDVAPTTTGENPTGVIEAPGEPPDSDAGRTRAAELFRSGCAPCHGLGARGDGVREQIDDKGFPTRPRDLTTGVFKSIPTRENMYRRIVAGLPGSPMPSSAYLHGDDAWNLTRFVLSLSSEEMRRRAEMHKFEITVPRVAALPIHPDDGLWRNAPPVNLHLMPLWWRNDRPEELTVRAMHDGSDAAFLLTWADETDDHTAMRPQDFRDAVAIEFATSTDPPFFGMGNPGEFVNIWMWKSERQADLQPAFQDLERVYPNIGIDAYPNLTRSPVEQPLRHALTLESDPVFVTAWGAGNIVADPTRRSPAEDLRAQGLGTLTARPRPDQQVEALGVYGTGTYHVVLRRSLKGHGEGAVTLRPGQTVPVAFAVWNGSAGDRDGKKSVTIWQDLHLGE